MPRRIGRPRVVRNLTSPLHTRLRTSVPRIRRRLVRRPMRWMLPRWFELRMPGRGSVRG
jgi:hypothetical protein